MTTAADATADGVLPASAEGEPLRLLITGAGGQLGYHLELLAAAAGHTVLATDRTKLDFTNFSAVREVLCGFRPDAVVHAGAYTQVDLAESNATEAFRVNAYGSRNLAVVAEELSAKMCYLSTDYVFAGDAGEPYLEHASPQPRTVYGQSKRAGEELVLACSRRAFVVRTSWVYGLVGSNFVRTMLRLGQEAKQKVAVGAGAPKALRVVADQFGSPTYTGHLAAFLLHLIRTEWYGVYHATNQGVCTWYDFAAAIFEMAKLDVAVEPCTTEEFPRPAPRPRYSALAPMAMVANGFSPLPTWREGLRDWFAQVSPPGLA